MQQIIDREAINMHFVVAGLLNRDLQKADNVFCKIYLKNGNQEEFQINQTDVACLGPKNKYELYFYPFSLVEYQFEVLQTLRVEIYEKNGQDVDQLIAQVSTNIGQIITWARPIYNLNIITIQKIGVLNIKAKMASVENKEKYNNTYMIWEGLNLLNTDFFGKSDPFLIFYKMMYEKWEKVLETYYIKNNLNPIWNVIEISDDLLYKDNPQQLIKIECWDNSKSGKHNFIGETITSKNEIENRREFDLSNKGKTKGFGTLKLLRYERGRIPKFIDYLIGREKLNLIIGVDFTGSNGNPESSESLHYVNDHNLNQYQQTVKAFGDIVLNYTDGNIEMFGFGGIPKGKDKAKFCFPLNDKQKHPLKNIKEIMQVYENSVKQVKQSGPRYVQEILKHAKEQSKIIEKDQHNSIFQQYLILLIMTDGIINDLSGTIQLIQDCEQLPLSIIFIGVGNEDFNEMKKVFSISDVKRNKHRQIYQFELFKEYNDPTLLMQAVLKKLPEQYLNYKKINGRGPFYYFDK